MSIQTLKDIIRAATHIGAGVPESVPIKFFVQSPDEPNRIIELELFQQLDGGDGSLVLQLRAKE